MACEIPYLLVVGPENFPSYMIRQKDVLFGVDILSKVAAVALWWDDDLHIEDLKVRDLLQILVTWYHVSI